MLDPQNGLTQERKEMRLDLLEPPWLIGIGVHHYEAVHSVLGAKLSRAVMRATEHLVMHDTFVDVAGEELIALARDDAIDHPGITASFLPTPTR